MVERIVVDLDDFEDAHAIWAIPLLDRLHKESNGRFKATLFTIPARTTMPQRAFEERPWLEVAVHGWDHSHLECREWTAERTAQVLKSCDKWAPIFKAPYWVAGPLVYEALAKANWAVADHPKNLDHLPGCLRRYVLSPNHGIGVPHHILPVVQAHGHLTHDINNGLREHLDAFRALAQWGLDYAFVGEVLT